MIQRKGHVIGTRKKERTDKTFEKRLNYLNLFVSEGLYTMKSSHIPFGGIVIDQQ